MSPLSARSALGFPYGGWQRERAFVIAGYPPVPDARRRETDVERSRTLPPAGKAPKPVRVAAVGQPRSRDPGGRAHAGADAPRDVF